MVLYKTEVDWNTGQEYRSFSMRSAMLMRDKVLIKLFIGYLFDIRISDTDCLVSNLRTYTSMSRFSEQPQRCRHKLSHNTTRWWSRDSFDWHCQCQWFLFTLSLGQLQTSRIASSFNLIERLYLAKCTVTQILKNDCVDHNDTKWPSFSHSMSATRI